MPIEVTVKTLDSNVFPFSVPDEITVKEFKEHISPTVNVAWDKQRIIFGGKVLQDDRKLKDCKVDGKTVHLVQRLPQVPGNPANDLGTPTTTPPRRQTFHHIDLPLGRPTNNVIVEAIAVPTDAQHGDQIEQIIRQVISSMGAINSSARGAEQSSVPITFSDPHNRLVTMRSLLRVAFNSLHLLEGRTPDSYSIQNTQEAARRSADYIPPAGVSRSTTPPPPPPPNPNASNPERPYSFLTTHELRSTRQNIARVYTELDHLQERLRPFLTQYRQLLSAETLTADQLNEQSNRHLMNRVALITHAISHINHALSDFEIDVRDTRNVTRRYGHGPVAIHAQINLNSVTFVPDRGSNPVLQRRGTTVGQAAAQAANQVSSATGTNSSSSSSSSSSTTTPTAAANGTFAAPQPPASTSSTSLGASIAAAVRQAASGDPNDASSPIRITLDEDATLRFNPTELIRRVSNNIFSIRRSSSTPAASATAEAPAAATSTPTASASTATAAATAPASSSSSSEASTPTREETTASNTTTNTTDTPTIAGANMNRGPQSTSISALGPRTMVREVFDPFLICDSVWALPERGVSARRTASQRSASVPASARRRAHDDGPRARQPREPSLNNEDVETMFRIISGRPQPDREVPLVEIMNLEGSTNSELLRELFNVIASHLYFSDLVAIFGGEESPGLNRLRVPLIEFLGARFLNGEPNSHELIRENTNALVASWSESFMPFVRGATLQSDIDWVETLTRFLNDRLYNLITMIMTATPDIDQFGSRLYDACKNILLDLMSLLGLCCVDSMRSVERVLLILIHGMNSTIGFPALRSLVERASITTLPMNHSALHSFIVRRSATVPTPEDSMEVDREQAVQDSGEPAVRTRRESMQITTEAPVAHNVALQALQAAVGEVTSSSSREWMGGVPPQWQPIIARDMGAQNVQQRPLSDAYLSGMPTKRRRLMKSGNPSGLSNVQANLQEAIQRAGVRPRTSADALQADLERNNLIIQQALQKTIRDRLALRLTEDKDFEKEKFPYSKKMSE